MISAKPSAAAARLALDPALQRTFKEISRAAVRTFLRRSGGLLGGAVAFYSLLSILPVLVIAVYLAGLGSHDAAARAHLGGELARWIGPDGAATVVVLLGRAAPGGTSTLTRLLHAGVVVYASMRLFQQLRRSINHLWDVEPPPAGGLRGTLLKQARKYATALLMVILVEVILLAMIGLKTALALSALRLGPALHAPALPASLIYLAIEWLLSFGVVTLLFATMFRVLPDARIAWRDLWVGALVTALLFSAGATVISRYLGYKSADATFGDGGAIVMLLLWVNYSAQVFFLGVAFTGVWAEKKGSGIRPLPGAHLAPQEVPTS